MPANVTLPYNGLLLDRAGARRADPDWVERVRAHPATRVLGSGATGASPRTAGS